MEKNRRVSEQSLTNRQRAKKEEVLKKATNKKRATTAKVAIGTAVVSGLVIGGAYFSRSSDTSIEPTPDIVSTPEIAPIREITQEHVQSIVPKVASDYEQVTGVPVDHDALRAAVTLAPNLHNMTFEEKQRFCAHELDLCTSGAAGVVTKDDEIFIFKDTVDFIFSGWSDTDLGRRQRDEMIYRVLGHELSHWLPDRHMVSEELYTLAVNHFAYADTRILDISLFRMEHIDGALMQLGSTQGDEKLHIFRGIEEAESELIMRHVLLNGSQEILGTLDNPDDTYYIAQRALLDQLLKDFGPDYSQTIRMVAQARVTEGGREELMKQFAKRYGVAEDQALEHGFKIFAAIEEGNVVALQALIGR